MTLHDVCDPCWKALHPGVSPLRMIQPEECRCKLCGKKTRSGIRTSIPGLPEPKKEDKKGSAK